jgi:photosystem II stability/assembly factor-like uncharacterized protein
MNDEEFEREVLAAARRIAEGSAPWTLRSRVAAVPTEHPRSAGRARRFGGFRGGMRLAGAAAVLVLVVAVTALVAGGLLPQKNVVPPVATGSAKPTKSVTFSVEPSATETPSPSRSATASAPASPAPNSGIVVTSVAFFDALHGLAVGGSASGDYGVGWAAGSAVVWQTGDGGRTWAWMSTLPDAPGIASVATLGSSLAWLGASCGPDAPTSCQPAMFASRDGGRTWEKRSDVSIDSLSFVDETHGWGVSGALFPAVSTGSVLRATVDGGRTWADSPIDPCPSKAYWPVGVSFTDLEHGWVGCEGQASAGLGEKAVVRTTDGGRTWTLLANANGFYDPTVPAVGVISEGDYLSGIAMRASGAGLIWEGRGGIQWTSDGGRIWSAGYRDVDTNSAGAMISDRIWVLVVTIQSEQTVERTTDAGKTWQTISTLPPPG